MSSLETEHILTAGGDESPIEFRDPQEAEGFLLPEQWQFDTRVHSIGLKDTSRDRLGNTVSDYRLRMNDRSLYNLRVTKPLNPATNTAIYKTPAWITNSNGHNARTGQEFGKIGMPSIEVSALGEERDSLIKELAKCALKPRTTLRDLKDVSLARQAHVMLSVAKEGEYFGFDGENAFWFGESRGAMTLMGACAMAASHDIKIPFALAVAPCFMEGLSKQTIEEHRGQLKNEAVNILKLVGHVSLGRLTHYPNTVNPSPKSIAYEIAHAPTLLNGDAGRLAEYIQTDQEMLVLAFGGDLAGQYPKWQKHFEPYPNATVRPVPGAHLSIADKRTMDFVTTNYGKIAQQLRYGVPVSQLDYSHTRRALSIVE